ncbi:unnamed protein product, partial [Menidia menidia]
MAAEELEKMKAVADLSNKAIKEYEDLQERNDNTALECKRLEEERDEAMKKLTEFQKVSQMVIEEVSAIQEDFEIERMCRESAEALASKLDRQNRSLKRKSMMLLSHLSPETISEINEINLMDDEAEGEEPQDPSGVCLSPHCHTLISDRQNRSLKRKSMMLLSHLSPETISEINLMDDEAEGEEPQDPSGVCLSPHCHTLISELQNKLKSTLEREKQAVYDLESVRQQLRETRDELIKEKHDNTVLIAERVQQKKLLEKYTRVEEYEALQDTLNMEQDLRTEAETFARASEETHTESHTVLMSAPCSGFYIKRFKLLHTSLHEKANVCRIVAFLQMELMEEKLRAGEDQSELAALRRKLELLEEERNENTPALNPLSRLLSMIRKRRDVGADIPLVDQDSPRKAACCLTSASENFNRAPVQPRAASPSQKADEELQRVLLRRRDALESNPQP